MKNVSHRLAPIHEQTREIFKVIKQKYNVMRA